MTVDALITGGTVVDGTGAPGRRADIAIRDGRIVAVGDVDETAKRTIDASGLAGSWTEGARELITKTSGDSAEGPGAGRRGDDCDTIPQ